MKAEIKPKKAEKSRNMMTDLRTLLLLLLTVQGSGEPKILETRILSQ